VAHPDDTLLVDRHYVTLILRLTLDRGGHVIQGELVDMTNTLQKRFMGASGLNQAMESWLRFQEQPTADPDA
jgi:hypothetical protein